MDYRLTLAWMITTVVTIACGDVEFEGDPHAAGSGGAGGGLGGSGAHISGGAAGNAGVGGSAGGGTAGGPCASCGPLEECYGGQRCIAKLVALPGGFSIDATEVTRSQYEAWLASGPFPTQASWCSWNTTFAPAPVCMTSPYVCQGNGCGNQPQVCVDWCDADTYCEASGKQLCGKIGGGPNGWEDYADATLSQWYDACSSHGVNAYPYGNTLEEGTCNAPYGETGCANGCTTAEVGTFEGCQSNASGYAGVYDLCGNAWEWEASCEQWTDSTWDQCRIRGASFGNAVTVTAGLRCDYGLTYYGRDSTFNSLGFRCCSR